MEGANGDFGFPINDQNSVLAALDGALVNPQTFGDRLLSSEFFTEGVIFPRGHVRRGLILLIESKYEITADVVNAKRWHGMNRRRIVSW